MSAELTERADVLTIVDAVVLRLVGFHLTHNYDNTPITEIIAPLYELAERAEGTRT